jgi:hypothetical protein
MKSSKNSHRTCRNLLVSSIFSLLLAAAAQGTQAQVIAPAPVYVPLSAVQLDQLVAPIALDPDPLVAQILTASTFPDQVNDSDGWLDQNMSLTPDQRANQANNMSWDASVKGLIAFPAVLDSMAKNTAWTTQLGNAYFNQPGDVMNAIQAMRLQAQQANILVTTVQERVVVADDVIEIVPVNPAVVYVPYYNPWRIWGTLFVAYPGYVELPPPAGVVLTSAVAFEPAINIGVYTHFSWGFSAWSPSWSSGTVERNHMAYVSQSRSVINHGHFGGHDNAAFEHGGRGVPRGYRASARPGMAHSVSSRAALQHTAQRNGSNRLSVNNRRPTTARCCNSVRPNQTRSNLTARNGSSSHGSNVSRPNARTTSMIHPGSPSRSNTMLHNASSNRNPSVRRPTSGLSSRSNPSHSASTNRSLNANHSPSQNRSLGAGRSPSTGHSMSANRSMGANRPMGQNRSLGGSRSMGSPSAGRSFGAGANRSMGANRPMSRPTSATRSFGGGQSSFGGSRSMGHPGSVGRSAGGMSGGRRR